MSQYTTQVRWIVESLTPAYQGSLHSRIQQAAPLIFNFDFPLAQGVSRLALETKILAHYYTREIGCETYGLWQFWLENRMNEIMPYYNQLYDTVNRDFDYLQNVDLWEDLDETSNKNENVQYGEQETVDHTQSDTLNFTGEETIDSTADLTAKQVTDSTVDTEGNTTANSETNGTTTATDDSINSDYPQAKLSDTDYATSAVNSSSQGTSKDTTESTTDSTQTQTTSATVDNTSNQTNNQTKDTTNKQTLARTNDTNRKRNTNNDLIGKYNGHHVRHTAGLNGNKTYTELMQEYREALLNIDMMIINELGDLFMLIY